MAGLKLVEIPPQTPEQQAGMQIGDVEFEADMQEALDPISRLGMDPSKGFVSSNPSTGVYSGEYDVVNLGSDYTGSKGVWAHEFRHRGFNLLRKSMPRAAFSKQYGEGAAQVVYDLENERVVELFDRQLSPPDWQDSEGNKRTFESTYDNEAPNFTEEQVSDLIKTLSRAATDAMGVYGKLIPIERKAK